MTFSLFSKFSIAEPGDLKLLDWQPGSQMVVKETKILKPKFPVIDIHNHLGNLENTKKYLEEMDKAGVWKCVSLDARSAGDGYKEHLRISQGVSKKRFLLFFVPDFSKIDEPDFGQKEAKKLEEAVKAGIRGMKIHKTLGLTLRDKSGKLVPVDDPRIDPLWAMCGELGIPVMIHVTDPKAFFLPRLTNTTNAMMNSVPTLTGYSTGINIPPKKRFSPRETVFLPGIRILFLSVLTWETCLKSYTLLLCGSNVTRISLLISMHESANWAVNLTPPENSL